MATNFSFGNALTKSKGGAGKGRKRNDFIDWFLRLKVLFLRNLHCEVSGVEFYF